MTDRGPGLLGLLLGAILLQMFYYKGWPLRPDRLVWVWILPTAALHFLQGRLRRVPIGALEALMALFTLLVVSSLILSGGLTAVQGTLPAAVFRPPETRINEALNLTVFPFLIYAIARRVPYNEQTAKRVLGVIAWTGLYLAITALAERFGITAFVWPPYIMDASVGTHFGRSRGPFVNAVFMGLNQAVCLTAALVYLQWNPSHLRRLVLLSSVPMLLAGIYLTNTRGPWVVLALCLAVLSTLRTPVRRTAQVCVMLIVCGFLFGGASKFSVTGGTLFSKRQNTIVDRQVNYTVALDMGLDNLARGVGFSLMGENFDRYLRRVGGSAQFGGWDGNHNEYLGIFAELGLPALICYVAILAMVLASCRGCLRHGPADSVLLIGALALCAMLGLAAIGLFNQIRSAPFHICLAYLLAGLADSAGQRRSPAAETSGRICRVTRVATSTLRTATSES